MNLPLPPLLPQAVSDIDGKTGIRIIEAEYEAKAKAQHMEYLRREAKKMGLELVDTTKAA